MIRALFVFLFCFVFVSLDAQPAYPPATGYTITQLAGGAIMLGKTVLVLGKPRPVRVICKNDPTLLPYATQVLGIAERYIPAVANYFELATTDSPFTITDADDAANYGRTIKLGLRSDDKKNLQSVPLIFHEITHWWLCQKPKWLSEGASCFLPVALHQSGYLKLTEDELRAIRSWWGFNKSLLASDRPVTDDEFDDLNKDQKFNQFYEKGYKIQYLLFHELGKDRYRDFLKSLLEYRTQGVYVDSFFIQSNPQYLPATGKSTGILQALAAQKNLDWASFLSGWVLQPGYKEIKPEAFTTDTDLDGLFDIEERYAHTNPQQSDTDADGLPDGTEVLLGTDPLHKQSPMEVRMLMNKAGVVLDGLDTEWDLLPEVTTVTAKPNPQYKAKYDLVSFSYRIQDGILYGMMRTREPITYNAATDKGAYLFLNDVSDDVAKERDGLGFWYDPGADVGWEWARVRGTPVTNYGKMRRVFEFKFSIADCPHRVLKLVPIIRPPKSGENIGVFDGYKPIEIPLK